MLDTWLDPDHWFKKRDDSIRAARDCRRALCTQRKTLDIDMTIGEKKYHFAGEPVNVPLPADHPKVKKAVGFWISRARHFHDIAMGRQPVIKNLIALTAAGPFRGPMYVENRG